MRGVKGDNSQLLAMAARPGGVSTAEYREAAHIDAKAALNRVSNSVRAGVLFKGLHKGAYRYFTDHQAADYFVRTGHLFANKDDGAVSLEYAFGMRKPAATVKTQAISSVWQGDTATRAAALEMAAREAESISLPVHQATPDSEIYAKRASASLGWQVGQAEGLDSATLDAVMDQTTAPNVLEANDLVCAINSRGELVIDLGEDTLIKFPPVQALALHTFLGNTSVLQNLQQRGLL